MLPPCGLPTSKIYIVYNNAPCGTIYICIQTTKGGTIVPPAALSVKGYDELQRMHIIL